MTTQTTITAKELHDRLCAGMPIQLIDVARQWSFVRCMRTVRKNVPLHQLNPSDFLTASQNAESPLFVICKSGGRGKQACDKLRAAGCQHVINVEGGTGAWDQAGFPVTRGQKAISLERQVRIAAGFLLLVGTLLAIFVEPWFVLFNGLIGAGLVFAGVTDFCGMGLILAKMPWNKVSTASACEVAKST